MDQREEKVRHLSRCHFETISCNWRVATLNKLTLMLIAEVKAGVIQTGIVENAKLLNGFARKMLTTLPLGVDPTQTLLKLPFFRVIKQVSMRLQESVYMLKKGYEDLSEDLVFGEIFIPSIDPEKIISTRKQAELILTRSKLIKKLKSHMADLKKTQRAMLEQDYNPTLRE